MKPFYKLLDRARADPRRIVLPESGDPRIVEAAATAVEEGIAQIVLIGEPDAVRSAAGDAGVSVDNIEIRDPTTSARLPEYTDTLYALRAHKGMTQEQAAERAPDPLWYANLMVHTGDADGCVAGAQYTTAEVVRTALQLVGQHEHYDLVSSFFIMMLCRPFHSLKGALIFADCGLIIEPDAGQLAQIAIASADSARHLLHVEPHIAMLSFSTHRSAEHPLVDKVVEATRHALDARPDLHIVGDIQLDAAIVPEILAQKAPDLEFDERANILIFPNIESGNIAYKLAERIGQADAIGPILQGLKKPVNDLSRGCSAEDVFRVIAVTVVQSQAHSETA